MGQSIAGKATTERAGAPGRFARWLGISSSDSTQPWDSTTLAVRLSWIFVAVGITARLVRYLLQFPLWGDECMLAENFLTRDAAGLLAPLDNGQVAPLGFIEAVWGMTRLFGFNELSLRFVACAASLIGLVAMRQLAFRLLPPVAAMFAVAFLAAGYYPVRHATEIKPYALDLAWAAILLWFAVSWCRAPQQRRWLWALVVATPLALLTSFATTFVAGGICVGLFAHAFARRSRADMLAVVAYGAVLVGAFAGVYKLTATSQYETHGTFMRDYWKTSFPPSPVSEPLHWLSWMVQTHTGEMFAYPLGADHGGSTYTLLASLAGAVMLWRRGDRWFVVTCAATFALGYTAAALHRFPYGDNERMVQYLGPIICLLAGTGTALLIEQVRTVRTRHAIMWATAILLTLVSTGSSVRDLVRPYKYSFDANHRGMARWFWRSDREATDLYCARTDLGYNFWPKSWQSHYLCYQHIYSPKHPLGKPVRSVADLPADRPANVVVFSNECDPTGGKQWDEWMASMTQRFSLVDCVDHRVIIDRNSKDTLWGHYRVYRFAPKPNYTNTPDGVANSASPTAR